MTRNHSLAAIFLSAALVSCSTTAPEPQFRSGGLDRTDLDTTVAACDDFYTFANGGWQKKNPIPAAYPSWGSFNVLRDSNYEKLRGILDESADRRASLAGEQRMLADFYSSCMDEAAVERLGVESIRPYLNRIDSIRDVSDIQNAITGLFTAGISTTLRRASRSFATISALISNPSRRSSIRIG